MHWLTMNIFQSIPSLKGWHRALIGSVVNAQGESSIVKRETTEPSQQKEFFLLKIRSPWLRFCCQQNCTAVHFIPSSRHKFPQLGVICFRVSRWSCILEKNSSSESCVSSFLSIKAFLIFHCVLYFDEVRNELQATGWMSWSLPSDGIQKPPKYMFWKHFALNSGLN